MQQTQVMYARAVEVVLADLQRTELLTSRDIAGAAGGLKVILQREEREQQFEQLLKTVVAHVNNQHVRFDIEAEMESRARLQRGLPHVHAEALLVQLALQEVVDRVPTNRLTIADIRAARRAAKTRIVTALDG